MEIGFRWDFAYEIFPALIRATGNTILAAGIGYLIAVFVGLVFLLGQKNIVQNTEYDHKRNRRVYSLDAAFDTIVFRLFRAASIWNNPIGLGLRDAHHWSAFWNVSLRGLPGGFRSRSKSSVGSLPSVKFF